MATSGHRLSLLHGTTTPQGTSPSGTLGQCVPNRVLCVLGFFLCVQVLSPRRVCLPCHRHLTVAGRSTTPTSGPPPLRVHTHSLHAAADPPQGAAVRLQSLCLILLATSCLSSSRDRVCAFQSNSCVVTFEVLLYSSLSHLPSTTSCCCLQALHTTTNPPWLIDREHTLSVNYLVSSTRALARPQTSAKAQAKVGIPTAALFFQQGDAGPPYTLRPKTRAHLVPHQRVLQSCLTCTGPLNRESLQ